MSKLWVLFIALFCLSLHAEDYSSWQKFSKARLILETNAVAPGHRSQMGVLIDVAPGWHLYWANPGDTGEPIKIKVSSQPLLDFGQGDLPYPTRLEVAGITSFVHKDQLLIPIELKVPSHLSVGSNIEIKVVADWLICQKVCIPAGGETLKLSVPVEPLEQIKPSGDAKLFSRFQAQIPTVVKEELLETRSAKGTEAKTVKVRFPKWTAQYEFVDFFPYKGKGVKNSPPVKVGEDPLELELVDNQKESHPDIGWGVLLMKTPDTNLVNAWSFGSSGWKIQIGEAAAEGVKGSLLWILFSAFLGGLILNAMPCVFPILSMKLLSLVKLSKGSRSEILKQNLAYSAGVLLSFLLIGALLLALRQSGQLVGWGFQLQSPVFVAFLVWLFTLLSLQLAGFIELDFLDANMGHHLTRLHGWAGSFFTGVLAVIVASPCTAPFMGVALGFALLAPWWTLLLVFAFLGLGLAFPYLLIGIFPSSVKLLPKPGAWMQRFKELMALPLVLTALWLLWLVGQLSGLAALSVVLAGSIVLVFAVWLSRWKKIVSWLVAGIFLVMCVGWLYQQQAPQASTAKIEGPWLEYTPNIWKKYPNQIVYIDVTADWCLTCKVNERLVLETEEIQNLFKQHQVVLVRADWTQRNPEITQLLSRFSRAGVPFNVLFSPQFPEGKVLPEVLTKAEIQKAIAEASAQK